MKVVLSRVDPRNDQNAYELGEFSVVFPAGDMPAAAIALITFGEGLQAIGFQERGQIVASHTRRFRVKEVEEISPPVEVDEIAAEVPPRFAAHVGYGELPEQTGEEVLNALVRLRPELRTTVEYLRELGTPAALGGRGHDINAMEKDAIGLAMGLQGIDRRPLQRWSSGAEPEGFLRGLDDAVLREDQIVNHDLGVFGDWEVVRQSAVGAVHFERDGSELTVVNVNRTPVEEALGVDLVYHHGAYDSFVLVQYKRMEGTGSNQVYRPDGSLEGELEAMRAIVPDPPDPVDQYSYRLGPGVCYLKLCKSVVLEPHSRDLLEGLYLPLEYFDACEPTARGERGGRAYGYETVPRHLNNTQFIDLVQDGWVGSNGPLSERLRQLVEELVQRGDSVLLAAGTGRRRRLVRH